MRILVAYDIANPCRLRRVAKIMEDFGVRVQKSIFEVDVGLVAFREMRRRIERAIEPEVDGVKFYPLCEKCRDLVDVIGLGDYIGVDKPFVVF